MSTLWAKRGWFGKFTPARLFALSNTQGAWYDPSDFSTLFQDSGGTTPVTAVEQPVGRMLDKSGRGNHATQSTSASRPTLRARYNLLTRTEEFDNAWVASLVTVTANAAVAPDGTTTANKITETAANGGHAVFQNVSVINGATYTMSAYLKKSERDFGWLKFSDDASNWGRCFNLATGQVGNVVSGFTAPTTSTITDAGNGWWRCTITMTAGNTGAGGQDVGVMETDGTRVYLGDGTSGILIWGAQLLTAADQTATGGAYQRVGAATDYATGPAFPPYLAFDGTDDSFATGNVDFSATDEMTVFAGVHKASDAAVGVAAELSANFTGNTGTFNLGAPGDAGAARYSSGLRGTSTGFGGVETFAAPTTNVVTQQLNIAQATIDTEIVMRVNGAQQTLINTSAPTTAGTGNFGNHPLFIGRRNNASLPFNGRIYSLIVLDRTATSAEIASTETWINSRTRAY